ncbi:MAG: hypothetical protein GDA52_06545 [Rhodobacteraceae bacterium]|nr:hypothetical protein [Paracoccaceae bacterium]
MASKSECQKQSIDHWVIQSCEYYIYDGPPMRPFMGRWKDLDTDVCYLTEKEAADALFETTCEDSPSGRGLQGVDYRISFRLSEKAEAERNENDQ